MFRRRFVKILSGLVVPAVVAPDETVRRFWQGWSAVRDNAPIIVAGRDVSIYTAPWTDIPVEGLRFRMGYDMPHIVVDQPVDPMLRLPTAVNRSVVLRRSPACELRVGDFVQFDPGAPDAVWLAKASGGSIIGAVERLVDDDRVEVQTTGLVQFGGKFMDLHGMRLVDGPRAGQTWHPARSQE